MGICTAFLYGCATVKNDLWTGSNSTGSATWTVEQWSWVTLDTETQDTFTGPYDITLVATWLEVPWSIAFLDQDTFYVTERKWDIYKIHKGEKKLYFTVPAVWSSEEAGLMGIVVDRDYITNQFVYISYATDKKLQIVRYRDDGNTLVEPKIIMSMLPVAKYHAGGGIKLGPDGLLYFSVGDATEKAKAQDIDTYHGKILRVNTDGTIPEDNPFSWSAIWSFGHRNVQWFDRDENGNMYASEHWPSVFDGPAGGDEVNHITPWANYGRPIVSHKNSKEGMADPLVVYTPAVAPASLIVYREHLFPNLYNKILIGTLKGESIIVFDPSTGEELEKIGEGKYGRIRAIVTAPDGSIYFTTSNNDGRWKRQVDGDKIYKIGR